MPTPRFLSVCRDTRFLLSTLATWTLAACSTVPPTSGPTFTDIPYAHASGRDLLLDIYLPGTGAAVPTTIVSSPSPRPVIVFFHGGGWRVGDKSEVRKKVAALVGDTGYALVSVNYRLSQHAIFPAPILDGKAAVRWVRAHASRYGFDPARVGAMGFSAGGHLAALLGTTAGVAALDDPTMGNAHESSRVQAVCDVSGPVDMNIPTDSIIGKLSVFGEFGGSAQAKPELVREADPSLYVKAGDPPFLIIQGEQDHLVIPAHAQRLYTALKAKGVEATLDLVPGGGHVPYGDAEHRATKEFFVRHFGKP